MKGHVQFGAALLLSSVVTAACGGQTLIDSPTAPTGVAVQLQNETATRDIYVSDLAWTAMTNGWGPVERDRSNGQRGSDDGRPITIEGQTYEKGLGVHADSEVRYALKGACVRFTARVGIDDEVGSAGSAVFHVSVDGRQLFESGVMTGTMEAQTIAVSVAGAEELVLAVTDAHDGIHYDHANWADARLTCFDDGRIGG